MLVVQVSTSSTNCAMHPVLLAPLGIAGTCVCSAITGTLYLLALLFAIPNVALLIENNSGTNGTEDLTVATYRLTLPLRGTLALTILLIINMYFAGISAITAASRIGYELAIHRERMINLTGTPIFSYLCSQRSC